MNAEHDEFPIGGISPHGGELVNRVLFGQQRQEALARVQSLRRLCLTSAMRLSDLELLAIGAFSPLTGFMVRDDYERVVAEMRLYSDLVWSVPVTLAVTEDEAAGLAEGQ